MPEAFHMEIKGFDELVEKLTALKTVAENKEAIHQVIATELFHATERAFSEKHDPNTGKPWKEWSPAYVKHLKLIGEYKKRKKLCNKGDNGGLFNSIHYRADAEGGHIGANIKYARIHQLGGTVKPKGKFKVKAHTRTVKNKKTSENILQNVREHERSGSARTIPVLTTAPGQCCRREPITFANNNRTSRRLLSRNSADPFGCAVLPLRHINAAGQRNLTANRSANPAA